MSTKKEPSSEKLHPITFCTECQKAIPEQAMACFHCGAKQNGAEKALQVGIDLAKVFGARVALVHCYPPPLPSVAPYGLGVPSGFEGEVRHAALAHTNAWAETISYLDPGTPFESLAKVYSLVILNNNLNHRLNLMEQLIRDFRVDGLVIQVGFTSEAERERAQQVLVDYQDYQIREQIVQGNPGLVFRLPQERIESLEDRAISQNLTSLR